MEKVLLKLGQLLKDMNEKNKDSLTRFTSFEVKISHSEKDGYFYIIVIRKFTDAYSRDIPGGSSEIPGTGTSFEEAYNNILSQIKKLTE